MRILAVWSCVALAAVGLLACSRAGSLRATAASSRADRPSSSAVKDPSSVPARPLGEGLREAWPVNADVVWVWTSTERFTGPEQVEFTTDAGRSWTNVTPAGLARLRPSEQIASLFVLDARRVWLTVSGIRGGSPTVLSTADAGRHWSSQAPIPAGCRLDFVSPEHGWCVVDRATMGQDLITVYATGNGGRSWRRVNRPGSPPARCDKNVGFSTATLGWVVTACAAGVPPLYRSRDGGAYWTPMSVHCSRCGPDSAGFSYGAMFSGLPVISGQDAAVAFDLGKPQQTVIYRSIDGGSHWQPIRPPGPTSRWSPELRSPDSWILAHGARLLRTDNAGRSWTRSTMDRSFPDLSTGGSYVYAPHLLFDGPSIGWVVELDRAQLWRTTSGGRSWTRIAIPHL
jgi:photosystem II stability/assembly factor-like uncharacterized protein